MPIQTPGDMSVMSLPGIDQAVQQGEFNALRNDAAKFQNEETKGRAKVRDQMEDAKFLKEIGEGYLQRLDADPQAYFNSYAPLKEEFIARGMDKFAEMMPPAITSPEQLKQDFAKMRDMGADGMAGRGPDTTYSQPVEGMNPDTGVAELYRPDSAGGMNPTGIGAPPAKGGITINTGDEKAQQKGDEEEQKALAQQRVAHLGVLNEAAYAAQETMTTIDQMRQIDFVGGPGTDLKLAASKMMMAIGAGAFVNVDEVVDAEAFNSLGTRELLNVMAQQKGPQTDRDFERIQSTFAQKHNPEALREFLMNSSYAVAARKVEMAEFYRGRLQRDGNLKAAEREWAAYKRSTPMLTDSMKDPDTGMPVFYVDFIQTMRAANPGVADERILKEWRSLTGGR